MAYFSSVTKAKPKPLVESAAPPLLQRLTVRSVQGITALFLLGTICGFLLLWQPAYLQWRSLQREENHWQEVLKTGLTNSKTDNKTVAIPTMDQLPDIIEQCRGVFVNAGVVVAALNVERFGEQPKTVNGASLDYGLVRLHLSGQWVGIVTSIKALEETQEGNIHLQEVTLDALGGEALLQIYFSMGE